MIHLENIQQGSDIRNYPWQQLVNAVRRACNVTVAPPLEMHQSYAGTVIGLNAPVAALMGRRAATLPSSQFDIISDEPALVTSGGTTIPFDLADVAVTNSAEIALTATPGEISCSRAGKIEVTAKVLARNTLDGNFYKWQIWLQKYTAAWAHVSDSVVPGLTDGGTEGQALAFTQQLDVAAGNLIRVRGMQLNGSSGYVGIISTHAPTVDTTTLHYGSKLSVKYLAITD